jgi:hypothetical protein
MNSIQYQDYYAAVNNVWLMLKLNQFTEDGFK